MFKKFPLINYSTEDNGKASDNSDILKNFSRDIDENNALGLRNMAWKPSKNSEFAHPLLDIDWLTNQPLLPVLCKVIPSHILYRSIVAHGFDDCIEVIEWVRGPQLVKVLDYDLWAYSEEKECLDISSDRVIQWFRSWLDISKKFAAERVFELDEETLVLIFTTVLEIIPDGIGLPTPTFEDDYWTTLDGRFHLRVLDNNPEVFEIVKIMIDALYETDMKFAGTILSHASMLVRNESLEDGLKWREARLSDDGFIGRDDALQIVKCKQVERVWDLAVANVETEKKHNSNCNLSNNYEDMSELHDQVQKVIFELEPEKTVEYLKLGLSSEKIAKLLEMSSSSYAHLDSLSILEDDDVVNRGVESLITQANDLWIGSGKTSNINSTSQLLLEQVFRNIKENRQYVADDIKVRMARLANVFVSATSKAFDEDSLLRALTVVRGAVNIGLEHAVKNWEKRGLNFSKVLENEIDKAEEVMLQTGPEILFQLGWNLVLEIRLSLAEEIEYKCRSLEKHELDDFCHNVKHERFVAVRKQLDNWSLTASSILVFVVQSVVNKIPFFPELLTQENGQNNSAIPERRAFETLQDVEAIQDFISNIPLLSEEKEF